MIVRIDGVELPLSESVIDEGKEAIFEAARRSALAKNSVIVDIMVDGVRLDDEETFFALSGGVDVSFASQPIIGLVRESVDEGQRYIPTLLKGLEGIATLIEEGREGEAQNSFAQAVEGINWLVGVFAKSCALLGITSEGLSSGDWDRDSRELNEVLEEIISIMESGRTMKMAFVIRERLVPAVGKFSSYWSDVASQLDSPIQ
jgi:hypothetical protein